MIAHPNNTEVAYADTQPSLTRLNIETGQPIAKLTITDISCMQYNDDGSLLLYGIDSSNDTVHECNIWDLRSNTIIRSLPNFSTSVQAQWDPKENKYVATCSDKLLQIWDMRNAKSPIAAITTPMQVYQPCYVGKDAGLVLCSAENQFVAVSKFFDSNPKVDYYDLYGKKTKDNQPLPMPKQLEFPPFCVKVVPQAASKIVASLDDASCQIVGFDLNNEANSFHFKNPNVTENGGFITTLACSPDGKTMASAGSASSRLNIWDISAGKSDGEAVPATSWRYNLMPQKSMLQCEIQ